MPPTRTVAPLGPASKEAVVAVAAGTAARAAATREVEAVATRGGAAVTGVTAATLVRT